MDSMQGLSDKTTYAMVEAFQVELKQLFRFVDKRVYFKSITICT